MNVCDYYVKEVLTKPKFIDKYEIITCWEIKVSYVYDNGETKETTLSFLTEKEAKEIKPGYHFLQ